jgi:hypothetical protein
MASVPPSSPDRVDPRGPPDLPPPATEPASPEPPETEPLSPDFDEPDRSPEEAPPQE